MRYLILSFIFMSAGCASVQIPGYISRADHPYDRKFYAGFEKVVSSLIFVLKTQGWTIAEEAEPAVFERDERYDNNGFENLLIMTDIKKHYRILYSTFAHLNVFIHSMGNTCDVEIRYEARTSLAKKFTTTRNDRLAKGILDAVEQEINRQ